MIAFYDGQCGLCHLAVVFLLKRDRTNKLFFAPLQSACFKRFAAEHKIVFAPKSILVYDPNSNTLIAESTAVLLLLKNCGTFWSAIAHANLLVPRAVRDTVYRFIARIRHNFFALPRVSTLMSPTISPPDCSATERGRRCLHLPFTQIPVSPLEISLPKP